MTANGSRQSRRERATGYMGPIVGGLALAGVVGWVWLQDSDTDAAIAHLEQDAASESARADTATDVAETLEEQLKLCASLLEKDRRHEASLIRCYEPRIDADDIPSEGESETQDPEAQDPELQDPELQDPDFDDPEQQDPESQDVDPNDPDPNDVDPDDPESQDPEIDDPETQDSEFDDPEQQEPEIQDPETDDPDPNDPDDPPNTITFHDFPMPGMTMVCTRDADSPPSQPSYSCEAVT